MTDQTQAVTFDFDDLNDETAELDTTTSNPNEPQPWGRLVSLNPNYPNVELIGDEIKMGRGSFCFVKFDDRLISGTHCRIFRETPKSLDANLGQNQLVFVEDLSTNGTWLNGNKLPKGQSVLLTKNMEIMLIQRRDDVPPVAYLYLDFDSMRNKKTATPEDEIHEKYDIRETLGNGNFASVKLAIQKGSGKKFAVKIIDKKKYMKHAGNRKNALLDEVEILKKLHHPNIIGVEEMFDTEKTLYIVLELVTGGELYDRIIENGAFSEDKTRQLFIQMVDAVHYVHKQGIVHRDLKPENILFSDKTYNQLKISDFGLSRTVGDGNVMQTICGTPMYIAPEILLNAEHKGYSELVDLWSLGAILYIMLSAQHPFDENRGVEQVKNSKVEFTNPIWENISEAAKDLIQCMLQVDPAKRYNTEQILQHPWITGENFATSPMIIQRNKLQELEKRKKELEEARKQEEELKKKKEEEDRIQQEIERRAQEKALELRKRESMDIDSDSEFAKKRKRDDSVQAMSIDPPSSTLSTSLGSSNGSQKASQSPDGAPKKKQMVDTRPMCKYGEQCYRKNPQHFQEFRHPNRD